VGNGAGEQNTHAQFESISKVNVDALCCRDQGGESTRNQVNDSKDVVVGGDRRQQGPLISKRLSQS